MKPAPILIVMLLSLAACKKYEVEDLTTNRFDPENTGPSFISEAVVWTETSPGGSNWHHITLALDPEVRGADDVKVRVIELPDVGTTWIWEPANAQGQYIFTNYGALEGQEYCYQVDLFVDEEMLGVNHRVHVCGTVE